MHSWLNVKVFNLFIYIKKIKIITDRARLRPIDADLQIPDTTKFYKATG